MLPRTRTHGATDHGRRTDRTVNKLGEAERAYGDVAGHLLRLTAAQLPSVGSSGPNRRQVSGSDHRP